MKIGIDARLWSEAGVGRYIRNLVRELSQIDSKNEYYLLLLKKNLGQKLPGNFYEVEADFRWYGLAEQWRLPKILNALKLDLVHFPHFNIPILYRGKFVVTIHDLIHQHHRMNRATTLNPLIYGIKHFAYNQAFKFSLKKSEKIITVSEFVKKQLIEEMRVPEKKIAVTYEAAEESLIKMAKDMKEVEIKKVLEKFGIKLPFIFYVGNAHPHKNVERLIEAFLLLRKNEASLRGAHSEAISINNETRLPRQSDALLPRNDKQLQLVLSGHDHYFWERIKRENKHGSIIYTGFVTDEELVALYKSCQVYVFPSMEEGFGIPLLEAMACGVPVVSSNAGSLPEIGGGAVVYFDPRDVEDMAGKIGEVLNDQKLRKELVEKGEKRYKEFSWKELAEETLRVYDNSDSVARQE